MGEFAGIDPDIRKGYGWALDRIFARAWQPVPPGVLAVAPRRCRPWTLLPDALDEPLLLTRDASGQARCLSNVCTHRGALLTDADAPADAIRCGYHGRRFDAAGRCLGMPGMDGEPGFPTEADHLPTLPMQAWGPLTFTALDAELDFATWLSGWDEVLPADLGIESWSPDPSRAPVYEVDAAWTLYVDNYLEGLHIPYVHPELSRLLDHEAYRTQLLPSGVVQIGTTRDGEQAIYGWFFPNVMLNVYSWGLSVNVVEPIAPMRCRIRYQTYLRDPGAIPAGPGGNLDLVEKQDHAVVASVQKGVRSRLHRPGRYVPGWEDGVQHFHRMLAARWNADHADR